MLVNRIDECESSMNSRGASTAVLFLTVDSNNDYRCWLRRVTKVAD